MNIIESRTDLITYLADTRPDLDGYFEDFADQIQFSDHPEWGDDWSEWLAETLGDSEFVDTVVHGVDALKNADNRSQLVATYKRLSRALADEMQPEADARALRAQLSRVRAELADLDGEG